MKNDFLYKDCWNEKAIENAQKMQGPILIVGVAGFIGASLFYTLRKYRADVYGCSRNPKKTWRFINDNSDALINCDITDYDNVKEVISAIKPMTIINLAAYGAYSRQTDEEKIHQTNYIGTLHLLNALSDTGCSAFIQAGSSSEYGLNC